MECPACGYVRAADDEAPKWKCPSCKRAYNKVGGSGAAVSHGLSDRDERPSAGRRRHLSAALATMFSSRWLRIPLALIAGWFALSSAAAVTIIASDSGLSELPALLVFALLFAALGFAAYRIWPHGTRVPTLNRTYRDHYCLSCGTISRARMETHGSLALEIALWLLALMFAFVTLGLSLVPVILYSIGRHFGRRRFICSSCHSDNVIPADSPRARDAL